jgi:NAD(P)H-dependent FMN reductase
MATVAPATNIRGAIPMPVLQVVIASTRPGRVGLPVAEWFTGVVRDHGAIEPEVVDLAEVDLPNYDEPNHPRLRTYVHEHTKAFSATIDRADAFAFVIPEYNYGMPPALLNALTFLAAEWAYKPAGLVSYGGVSAGTRSAQMTKQVLTTHKCVPLPEAVSIPFVAKFVGDDGAVQANDAMTAGATGMLDELVRWELALRDLRRPAS